MVHTKLNVIKSCKARRNGDFSAAFLDIAAKRVQLFFYLTGILKGNLSVSGIYYHKYLFFPAAPYISKWILFLFGIHKFYLSLALQGDV